MGAKEDLMRSRWRWIGVIAAASVAAPRAAAARTEMSARVPMGVAVGDGARFELGLRADVIHLFDSLDLGLGVSGEIRSVSFSGRAQDIGVAVLLPDEHLLLEAGYGTAVERRYVHGRAGYQTRTRLRGDSVAYAFSSGIFVDVRRTVSGPSGWEGVAGIELGGGLLALLYASTRH
jgi:hypothetical protein